MRSCTTSHAAASPPLQPQHPNWAAAKPAPPPKKLLLPLLEAADAVGQLVQYSHQVSARARSLHARTGSSFR